MKGKAFPITHTMSHSFHELNPDIMFLILCMKCLTSVMVDEGTNANIPISDTISPIYLIEVISSFSQSEASSKDS